MLFWKLGSFQRIFQIDCNYGLCRDVWCPKSICGRVGWCLGANIIKKWSQRRFFFFFQNTATSLFAFVVEGFTEETLVSSVARFVFVSLPDLHTRLLALEPCCVCGRKHSQIQSLMWSRSGRIHPEWAGALLSSSPGQRPIVQSVSRWNHYISSCVTHATD